LPEPSLLFTGFLLDGDLFLKAARREPVSPRIQKLLEQTSLPRFLSVVSVWQLLMRERAGLEGLPSPVLELIQGERSVLGLQTLPLQEHCLTHMDKLQDLGFSPWDQLLACQAMEHQLCLITERPQFHTLPLHRLPLMVTF